jgi:hypothetical protein
MLMSHDQQLGALMNNLGPPLDDEQAASVVPTDQSLSQALTRV